MELKGLKTEEYSVDVTLPALLKTFVNLFYGFARDLALKNGAILGEFFSGLRFPRNKARTISAQKFLGKFYPSIFSAKNCNHISLKFGKLLFCKFPDPPTLASFLNNDKNKTKGCSLRGTLKIIGKGNFKPTKEQRNPRTETGKGIQKKAGAGG